MYWCQRFRHEVRTFCILTSLAALGCAAQEQAPGNVDGGIQSTTELDAAVALPTECTEGDESCFDCSTAPDAPLSQRTLVGPRGYHGLAIDDAGFMVGIDKSGALIRSDYSGDWSVALPGLGRANQLDYLPGGDLAVAQDDIDGMTSLRTLMRITPQGGQSNIIEQIGAYGVNVGPDGMVYVAASDVERVDPDTGARVVLAPDNFNSWSPRVLDFSPDYKRLYVGGRSSPGNGHVYAMDLDENLDSAGPLEIFTSTPLSDAPALHDILLVDVCGYLYVTSVFDNRMFRISPSGVVSPYIDWNEPEVPHYAHGAVFGGGIGGWREDAIYTAMPSNDNQVQEIVIGVPGRKWKGTVINAPQ